MQRSFGRARGRVVGSILLCVLPAAPGAAAAMEKLAFVDRSGGISIDSGGVVRQVAPGPALPGAVAWSPAGDRVAYLDRLSFYGNDPIVLHLVSADGGARKTFVLPRSGKTGAVDSSIRSIEWFGWPSAGELAIEGSVGSTLCLLQVIDAASGRVIASGPGHAFSRAAHSGRWAAVGWTFHFAPPKEREHGWIQVDGRQAYPAIGEERSSGRMAPPILWSPDEQSIAFLEERKGSFAAVLWQQGADVKRIPLPAGEGWTAVGWSRDGHKLLLDGPAGYVSLDVRTGRRLDLAPEAAAEAAFPALAVARRHLAIEQSLHAQGAAWWPAESAPRAPDLPARPQPVK